MKKFTDPYGEIKTLIEHIVENWPATESLGQLATHLNVSSGHLQKVFTAWVGVTPKQFSRYLSLQYSKDLLRQNKNTTEATVQSGLSSSGRLYDLFVDIEAMTPGEYQNQGEGLTINYSIFPTKFGLCLAASTDRGICNVLFADIEEETVADLASRWPKSTIVHKKTRLHQQIEKYLRGMTPTDKIKLHLRGTNFQLKVWEALLSIPGGSVTTYGEIAERVGNKKLSRLVGSAVGDNPVGYIIPCHRALKSTGEISGYRWGITRKRAMLFHEAVIKTRQISRKSERLASPDLVVP